VRGSRELSPSLAQWEAIVKTSSCNFSDTTFSLNVQTLLGLAGHLNTKVEDWYHPGHPQDLAEILLVLGQITRGEIERIVVRGGPACCCLAVYSSFILGLRVEVKSNTTPLMKNTMSELWILNCVSTWWIIVGLLELSIMLQRHSLSETDMTLSSNFQRLRERHRRNHQHALYRWQPFLGYLVLRLFWAGCH
jgi:hypothetical protein